MYICLKYTYIYVFLDTVWEWIGLMIVFFEIFQAAKPGCTKPGMIPTWNGRIDLGKNDQTLGFLAFKKAVYWGLCMIFWIMI